MTIPVALLPDKTLAVLARLALPPDLARRVRQEAALRRSSDRRGPRLPVGVGEFLLAAADADDTGAGANA